MSHVSIVGLVSLTRPLALVASLFVAVGCSSTSGTGGGAAGGDAGNGDASCTLASPADANSALGVSGFAAPSAEKLAAVTVCTYDNPTTRQGLTIRFETGMSAADVARGRQGFSEHGQTTTDVAGIGDVAYSSTLGTGPEAINTLVVLKGNTEVLISVASDLAHVEGLARIILGKI